MTVINVAIVVNRLGDNWLGGVNYFRNLVAVFDSAADPQYRLHLLTDDTGFLGDLRTSARVVIHNLPMLQRKSAPWALRQALHFTTGRDLSLVAKLKQLQARAVLFKYVAGSGSAGIPSFPWIPDFQSQHHPELFPRALIDAENKNAHTYVRSATGLILSSQAACEDAVSLFGADRNKLHVLRFAPKLAFQPLESPVLRDEVFARYEVTRPYVFLPNQYWQHKNHRLVAEALSHLRTQGVEAPLVLSTGKTNDPRTPSYFSDFEAFLRQRDLMSNYRILGVIPREDMMVLMAHSVAVINPSRFEGWSTTVEEAKALGKSLLVSDIPVHREQVAGLPQAQIFAPNDVPGLAAVLAALQQRHRNDAADAHPPRPDASLYSAFTARYMALIKKLTAAPAALQ